MTTGYSSNATDSAVQVNIVAAGYGSATTGISDRSVGRQAATLRFDPSTSTASVGFTLGTAQHVRVRVLDMKGREIARLLDGNVSAGLHQAVWIARSVNPGIYAVALDAEGAGGWSANFVVAR